MFNLLIKHTKKLSHSVSSVYSLLDNSLTTEDTEKAQRTQRKALNTTDYRVFKLQYSVSSIPSLCPLR